MQIHTILGILWMQGRLDTTVTLFQTADCESEVNDRSVSLRYYLSELRKNDPRTDVSHNPEKAFQYIEGCKDAIRWAKTYLGFSIVALVVALMVGYLHTGDGTGVSYIFDFINLGGLVVSIISAIAMFISLYEGSRLKVSKASKLVGEMWGNVRQNYSDVGFVDAVVNRLMRDESLAGVILKAKTFPEQLRLGQMLREMFREHFINVGIPYARSQESGARVDPKNDARVKGRFDLMELLVEHMGINGHQGAERSRAYDAARRKIQEEDETHEAIGDKDTEILQFPPRGRILAAFKDTPPDQPPEPPKAA